MRRLVWLLAVAALACGCRETRPGWEVAVVVSAEAEHGPATARVEATFKRPAR